MYLPTRTLAHTIKLVNENTHTSSRPYVTATFRFMILKVSDQKCSIRYIARVRARNFVFTPKPLCRKMFFAQIYPPPFFLLPFGDVYFYTRFKIHIILSINVYVRIVFNWIWLNKDIFVSRECSQSVQRKHMVFLRKNRWIFRATPIGFNFRKTIYIYNWICMINNIFNF